MLGLTALVYVKIRVLITRSVLYDGSVAKRLWDDGRLVGQQAILLQQGLQVYGKEVFPKLVRQSHKITNQVPALVHKQGGQSAVPEQCAGADGGAAHAAELDEWVFMSQAQQAAAHGLAARHIRFVDVDHDQRAFVLLVQSLQEVLSTGQLIDLREAFAAAQLTPHFFNALHAVVLEEVFIVPFFLEHVVLLHCHLWGRQRGERLQGVKGQSV